ncbi:MAG: acetate--CoA ligase family protein [Planctomycetes bacterium]|nr:acetate--CoA ligase family protein [Planctomycetota bacterium]
MRLYEHEAKKVFGEMGLTIPRQYGVIHSPNELDKLDLKFPVMLKSMVLVGGRGKAGGIKKAANLAEAKATAEKMLGLVLKGYPVETLLVEEVSSERGACYVGATTNPATFNVILMASAEGGVEIEQIALEKPEAILKKEMPDNELELPQPVAREFATFLNKQLGGNAALETKLADAVSKLYATYQKCDCRVAEINPLLITEQNDVVAADAKVVLDDNALYRQGNLFDLLGVREARHDVSEPTRDEVRAREAGFTYLDLLPEDAKKDPDKLYVGLVPGGAGYGIFSIDETANVGERFFGGKVVPVNFMDSGGGPTLARVAEMFHLLMDKELVDVIVTSRFGGISSCDIFIRGLVQCLRDRDKNGQRVVPVYGRMVGTDLPSARAYLEQAKAETPDSLKDMVIIVGNQKIMADVIKEGVTRGFEVKAEKGGA